MEWHSLLQPTKWQNKADSTAECGPAAKPTDLHRRSLWHNSFEFIAVVCVFPTVLSMHHGVCLQPDRQIHKLTNQHADCSFIVWISDVNIYLGIWKTILVVFPYLYYPSVVYYLFDLFVGMCHWFRCVECREHHHCPSHQYCRNKNIPLVTNRCHNKKCSGWCSSGRMCRSGRCRWYRRCKKC